MEDAPAADQEQQADEDLAVELEQRQEDRAGAGGAHIIARVVHEQVAEERGIGLLAHEALGDADAGDRLRERRGDAGEALLGLALRLEELAAEAPVERPDERPHEHDEAEEHRVRAEHEDRGKKSLADADDGHENDVLHAEPDGLDVRRHAADDAPDFHVIEKRGRQALEMGEHGIAHIADHQLAKLERIEHPVAESDLRERRHGGKFSRADQRAAKIAMGDRAIDDRAEDMRQQR